MIIYIVYILYTDNIIISSKLYMSYYVSES